ncbi:L-asparaginase [Lishizhenia tianjinensis]|uniref:L-asparaginase n=1 Tax=Lishizhenia tianjinensis TaxID=477690 RepID=A0A1I6ZIZ3_9FLAO|nr:asparaginase [Lishizhenia tianjinensis]SFT62641.1 L-asparaginase [Lishizhenia tianjinensis]
MENAKVLLIYTGGTIGMMKDNITGELRAFDFEHLNAQVPELDRLNVDLSSISFDDPIDSSDMHPKDWARIAQQIELNYNDYDGFVVLHGSDTMAFTASGLSFMLQGLRKPVILTGSQLPIGTIRTDGKENLITSIEIAASKDEKGMPLIQEVAIYFEYSLYRGNRTTKVSAKHFEAFQSPNYQELAIAGVDINYHFQNLYRTSIQDLTLFTDFEEDIALLKLYPGINMKMYAGLFDIAHTKAIVLETFGAGNAPHNKQLQDLITKFTTSGGIILNITQCASGSVQQGLYESSSFFNKAGVVNGKDLTTESALAKLMYVLGRYSSKDECIAALKRDIVGEMQP